MIFIAQQPDSKKTSIKEIVNGIDCPVHFIAKILQDLGRKGLVQSLKGPNGGFFLDKKSLRCSLADIVRAVDGDKLFSGCGLGLKECSETHPCPIHHQFKKVRNDVLVMLNRAKLGEFAGQLGKNQTYLKGVDFLFIKDKK